MRVLSQPRLSSIIVTHSAERTRTQLLDFEKQRFRAAPAAASWVFAVRWQSVAPESLKAAGTHLGASRAARGTRNASALPLRPGGSREA